MKLKIEFGMDNAAFDMDDAVFDNDGRAEEASRILHEIAQDVIDGSESGDIRDVNGNLIGMYKIDLLQNTDIKRYK